MRYYLIAGEASGDLHASNLMKELKKKDPSAIFRCWGGDMMQQQGGELVRHYRDLAFMGFLEVVTHLKEIMGNLKVCEKDLLNFAPDVLILVDYPGFNLRIAGFAHKHGIRVFYYISPQLWAWRSSRVKLIKKFVEHMFVILPFEKEFYVGYDYPVDFVGHPLLDVINEKMPLQSKDEFLSTNGLSGDPIIALLPGSRKMEINKILRIMISMVPHFNGYQFVVAAAPSIPENFYNEIIKGTSVKILKNQTYDLLKHSIATLVTSGTATLESALMGVPQVVCYKGNFISFAIAKKIVHVSHISLVNLIAGKSIVKELIQQNLTVANLIEELNIILYNSEIQDRIKENYKQLVKLLGGEGASERTAALIIQYLSKN